MDLSQLQAEFAAERTFLSWIRTGLSLMGFGFVVARFGFYLRQLEDLNGKVKQVSDPTTQWFGTAMILTGVIAMAVSAYRYEIVLRSIREGRALPPSRAGIWAAVALCVGGLLVSAHLMKLINL